MILKVCSIICLLYYSLQAPRSYDPIHFGENTDRCLSLNTSPVSEQVNESTFLAVRTVASVWPTPPHLLPTTNGSALFFYSNPSLSILTIDDDVLIPPVGESKGRLRHSDQFSNTQATVGNSTTLYTHVHRIPHGSYGFRRRADHDSPPQILSPDTLSLYQWTASHQGDWRYLVQWDCSLSLVASRIC